MSAALPALRAPKTGKAAFGKSASQEHLMRLTRDPHTVRRIFFLSLPLACALLATEQALGRHLPWFLQGLVLVTLATALAFRHLFTARIASLLRLSAGRYVYTRNTALAPPKLVLYDSHFDPGCRLVREALSALALDAEIRSCPARTEGVPAPWTDELTLRLASSGEPFALPRLEGLDFPLAPGVQGDGVALLKALLEQFALEPKDCFPLDMGAGGLPLCKLASAVRRYAGWGREGHPVAWERVNAARERANREEGFDPSSSVGGSIGEGADEGDEQKDNQSREPSTIVSPTVASAASPVPPSPSSALSSARSMSILTFANGSGGGGLLSPSRSRAISSQAAPTEAALKLRADMARSALARTKGSRADGLEPLRPVFSFDGLQALTVYGNEASPTCRPVFELLCSLQLPYQLLTCAQGSMNRAKLLLEHKSNFALPTIIDPNTRRTVIGTPTVVDYLLATYTDAPKSL